MRGQARDYDQWAAAHRRRRLALGQLPARLQAARGPLQGRRRAARRRRRMAGREAAPALGHPRRLRRGGAGGRHSAQRRLQPRRQRRRRLLPGQPEERLALEHRQGLPAADLLRPAATSRCGPARRSAACCSRRSADGRPALHRRRGLDRDELASERRRDARGGAVRRQHRLAADPAAVGHRRRPRCCSEHGIPVVRRPARRRRQPAGPSADPRGLQGAGRSHAQHAGEQPGGARRRSAWNTLLKRSGPMSMAPSQLGAFTRSDARRAHRQHRVPRAAAEPRRLRRAAARLPRLHRQRLQPQPDQPRHGAHPQRRLRGRRRASRPTT